MHKAAELLIIQNMALQFEENSVNWYQQFLLTELAEVYNYVKFSHFNSSFTYIADALKRAQRAII